MTRLEGFLERQVEKLTNLNSELTARIAELESALEGVQISYKVGMELYLALESENETLRELVDGVQELVEIFPSTFPAQREWKETWLRKAREIFHANGKDKP